VPVGQGDLVLRGVVDDLIVVTQQRDIIVDAVDLGLHDALDERALVAHHELRRRLVVAEGAHLVAERVLVGLEMRSLCALNDILSALSMSFCSWTLKFDGRMLTKAFRGGLEGVRAPDSRSSARTRVQCSWPGGRKGRIVHAALTRPARFFSRGRPGCIIRYASVPWWSLPPRASSRCRGAESASRTAATTPGRRPKRLEDDDPASAIRSCARK
jgi:hypothetical protein